MWFAGIGRNKTAQSVRTTKARYSCRDWECAYNGGQAEHDLHELHRLPNTVGAEDKLPDVMLRIIRVKDFLPLRISCESAVRIVSLLILWAVMPERVGLFWSTCRWCADRYFPLFLVLSLKSKLSI